MKKRLLSLLCVLALCLGLLPVTALAAGSNTVYVGGVALAGSSDGIVYATTNESGEVVKDGANSNNYNIKWDGSTLTLHDATIQKELYASDLPLSDIAGAAIGVINQSGDAGLTVQLEGNNKIEGVSTGLRVRSSGGNAALNITGNGTLVVNSNYPTIQVTSIGGNAALSIENAKVTATSSYSNVVTVESNSSENSTLTVNGGGLIATAQSNNVSGIRLRGTSDTGGSSPTVTVSNNAIVRANGSAGGITSDSSTGVQYGTGSSTTGGIVFDGTEGTVYGEVELQEDLEIGKDETLTIPDGSSLDGNNNLTNNGTILVESGGTVTGETGGNGTVVSAPKITTESLSEGTVATAYNQTLQADNNPTKWSIADGFLPSGLTLNENTGEISGIPTTEGTSTFTAKAENSAGSDSKQYTLTIAPKPTVSVTGVKLDQASLSLTVGGTGTLNATVQPDNATNKAVTWSSSNETVATVENGVITAVGAGTADITVTTQDGQKTAVCAVTVTQPQPPSPPSGNDDDDDDDPLYFTALPDTDHGSVSVSPRNAAKGSTVTVTARPDEGYTLKKLTVTDSRGNALDLTGQSDGTYTFTMPAGGVTVKAVFAPVQAEEPQPEPEALPFADVPEDAWYADAVAYVYEQGLMTGTGAAAFSPDAATSRSMIAAILWRQAGSPAADDAVDFSDVAQGQWYSEAVRWAASEGIVGGYGDGAFGTDDPITREQLAVMLYRFAQHQGYDVSVGEDTNILSYTDAQEISEYAIPALQWACGAGILQGDGAALSPQGQTTRAEAAAMLMRFCQTCGDG